MEQQTATTTKPYLVRFLQRLFGVFTIEIEIRKHLQTLFSSTERSRMRTDLRICLFLSRKYTCSFESVCSVIARRKM